MIIVTMTSWVKRIGNCHAVINSVLNQTRKVDKIYLNLSSSEFKNEDDDLPENLLKLRDDHDIIEINWVSGENTKSMKKVFPILQYLDDNDIIINIDDDSLLPNDFIESRLAEWEKYKEPITSCNNPKFHYINKELKIWSCGPGSLFQKKMLNGWEEFCDDAIIKSYNDDWTYTAILWINGYKFRACEDYSRHSGISKRKLAKYNDYEPMLRNKVYTDGSNMYRLLDNRCKQIYDKPLSKCFSINRHVESLQKDAVFVLGTKSFNSRNDEIKVAVASLRKYCSSWLRNIYVVGENPNIEGVIHIPAIDPYTHDKDANIIHKIRVACEKIPNLSDDFLMCSDDQLVTMESSFNDFRPRYLRIYDPDDKFWINKKKNGNIWFKRLCQTLDRFGKGAMFFEPHIFTPMNKHKFIKMCEKYDYQNEHGITVFSLYYNFIGEKGVPHFDHMTIGKPPFVIPKGVRLIGYFDSSFANNDFRKQLNDITGANIPVGNAKSGSNKMGSSFKCANKKRQPSRLVLNGYKPLVVDWAGNLVINKNKSSESISRRTKSERRANNRPILPNHGTVSPFSQPIFNDHVKQKENPKRDRPKAKRKVANDNYDKKIGKETVDKDFRKLGFIGWTYNI